MTKKSPEKNDKPITFDSLMINTFSPDVIEKLEKSMIIINQITQINNQKIREFRKKVETYPIEVEELATIVSNQIMVLEEKYELVFQLVMDVYTKLDMLQKK